jgi:hypothetical protein
VQDPPLHVLDGASGITFIPAAVEVLGDDPKLDDQVVGQLLGYDLAALLPPQPNERGFVLAHDNARIRPADKAATVVSA